MEPLASGLHPQEVDELPEYRPVSALAIVGLLLAALSPLALVRTILIVLPAAAAVISSIALLRIRRAGGRRLGKTPAVIGLGLACLFLAAAPVQVITWNRSIHARATPVALAWLETLRQRQPQQAHQLMRSDLTRVPLDSDLWSYYARNEAARLELEELVQEPLIRLLLALGENAQARFYEPVDVVRASPNSQLVTQHFAVTYEDPEAGRTSFFLSITMERRTGANSGEQWRIASFGGGIPPLGL